MQRIRIGNLHLVMLSALIFTHQQAMVKLVKVKQERPYSKGNLMFNIT
jgi:hypothetical protein